MPKINVNGFPLHYTERGDGPAVVLIHGLSGDCAFWHPLIVGGLARRFRTIAVDLRGHGHSGTPVEGYTSRDMASDVAGLLDRLGIDRAHLVGHSYGGAVALHLAVDHPGAINRLVLADSRVRSLQPDQGVRQWPHWQRVRQWLHRHGVDIGNEVAEPEFGLLERLARCRLEGKLEGLTAGPFFIPFAAGSARRAQRWLQLVDETTALWDFKEIAGLDENAIRTVRRPTLLLYGSLSHCIPSRERLAEILTDSRSVTVKGAGHFLPLVQPTAFLDQVLGFLDAEAALRGDRSAVAADMAELRLAADGGSAEVDL